MDAQMHGWMDGWMGGWIDGYVDGCAGVYWVDIYIYIYRHTCSVRSCKP